MTLKNERGDVTIFIALLVMVVITSAMLIFTSLLAEQGRLNRDIVASEAAFYAATSGLEEALYAQFRSQVAGEKIENSVGYSGEAATYHSQATAGSNPDEICVVSEGRFRGATRRVTIGGRDCSF